MQQITSNVLVIIQNIYDTDELADGHRCTEPCRKIIINASLILEPQAVVFKSKLTLLFAPRGTCSCSALALIPVKCTKQRVPISEIDI